MRARRTSELGTHSGGSIQIEHMVLGVVATALIVPFSVLGSLSQTRMTVGPEHAISVSARPNRSPESDARQAVEAPEESPSDTEEMRKRLRITEERASWGDSVWLFLRGMVRGYSAQTMNMIDGVRESVPRIAAWLMNELSDPERAAASIVANVTDYRELANTALNTAKAGVQDLFAGFRTFNNAIARGDYEAAGDTFGHGLANVLDPTILIGGGKGAQVAYKAAAKRVAARRLGGVGLRAVRKWPELFEANGHASIVVRKLARGDRQRTIETLARHGGDPKLLNKYASVFGDISTGVSVPNEHIRLLDGQAVLERGRIIRARGGIPRNATPNRYEMWRWTGFDQGTLKRFERRPEYQALARDIAHVHTTEQKYALAFLDAAEHAGADDAASWVARRDTLAQEVDRSATALLSKHRTVLDEMESDLIIRALPSHASQRLEYFDELAALGRKPGAVQLNLMSGTNATERAREHVLERLTSLAQGERLRLGESFFEDFGERDISIVFREVQYPQRTTMYEVTFHSSKLDGPTVPPVLIDDLLQSEKSMNIVMRTALRAHWSG